MDHRRKSKRKLNNTLKQEKCSITNLKDTTKSVLRGKFMKINVYIKKEERSQIKILKPDILVFSCTLNTGETEAEGL
jgi:hypothetical protein